MANIAKNSAAQPSYRDFAAIRSLTLEATALGARFRTPGADVEILNFDNLPGVLQSELEHYRANGLLWTYLGGDERDSPSLALLEELGVAVELIETREAARGAVRTLISDAARHTDDGAIGLDIETAPLPEYAEHSWAVLTKDGSLAARQPKIKNAAGLSPHTARIATLQLYAGGERCFVFRGEALQMVRDSHWFRLQRLVIHNAVFELEFLMHEGANYLPRPHRRNRGRFECTMQAGGLMHGTGFHGETRALDRLARVRLQIDVPKGLQLADWDAPRPSPGQIAYAGGDSVVAHRMWPDLRDALKRKGRWAAYGLQRRAAPVVAAMGLVGIGFDRAEHARHVDTWSRELAAARRQYVKLTGRPPPSKPSEIRGWLAVVLSADELERWQRTKADKALSISKDNLLRLAHIESALPVLDIINREKLLSTFGAKLLAKLNPVTGRLHPSFNLAATKAGRFSASDRNFQQMPTSKRAPGFRKCFVAALGHVLVGCDFSQIELRALAEISGNRALRRAFAHGIDIHRSTAAGIAGIPLE